MRRLQAEGRDEEALERLAAHRALWPQNRDLLLLEASCLRRRLRVPEALEALDALEALQPRFSRLHEERGLCYVAQKKAAPAIEALLQAVNVNPALPMSWRMLKGLYQMTGEAEKAATCAEHLAALAALPREVVAATALFSDGDLAPAEAMIRAFLIAHGDHLEGMRLLAKIGLAREIYDDAELLLAEVVRRAPEHRAARYEYAQALIKRQKYAAARTELDRLLELDPHHPDYRSLAAAAAVGLGDQARAIGLYQTMLRDYPGSPDLKLWLGHALKTVGRVEEAVEAYRAAAGARADFGDAYWSLANLKRYRFSAEEEARMRAFLEAPTTASEDQVHLAFALGKALEDRGEVAEAFAFYARGNAQKRAESRYAPELLEENTRRQKATLTRAFLERRTGWGDPRRDPIFIVGLPRSGSTLIEQILASHSQVEGTQELSNVQAMVLELQGGGADAATSAYPDVLAEMDAAAFAGLGARYLSETRVFRSERPFFIDKMPNNFRHLGLIHLMLPNARIIDARREPMSCCFSNFKQLFAQGQEFSYSLEDIARYYRTYLDLMSHWEAALPGKVLRVQHEDVVEDLEGQVRRLLDHCGLPFEPGCVAFFENPRSVRTPSSEQVRQPIFRDGLDQWRRFETHLEPLRAALGDALVRYRD